MTVVPRHVPRTCNVALGLAAFTAAWSDGYVRPAPLFFTKQPNEAAEAKLGPSDMVRASATTAAISSRQVVW
jgi:hypothetical protein